MNPYRLLPLSALEPGPMKKSRRAQHVSVVETSPGRYMVIGGHDHYWRRIAEGGTHVFCEIVGERTNPPR